MILAIAAAGARAAPTTRSAPLRPGDHRRELTVDGRARSYVVHVAPKYDAARATPVVLAFHGAGMNGPMMTTFSGLSAKADAAGFAVVYPNGTGFGEAALFFNAWADAKPAGQGPADDVAYTAKLLDDLATVLNLDAKRAFATGMSNGGMMCHRLAAELPDRIAAVASVGGTLAMPRFAPKRPVPVMHIHGTADRIVPVGGPGLRTPPTLKFKTVAETVDAWVKFNECPAEPLVTHVEDKVGDGTTVNRKVYGPGKEGAEVVFVEVVGGGHTWPGREPPVSFIGKSTRNISANDLIWDFFERHAMK